MPCTSCRSRGLRPIVRQLYLRNIWIYWIVMIQCLKLELSSHSSRMAFYERSSQQNLGGHSSHHAYKSVEYRFATRPVEWPSITERLVRSFCNGRPESPFFPAVGRRLGTGESHISRRYISLTESFIPRVQRRSLAPLIIPRNIACVP